MAELLEATRKIIKYFKRSYKYCKSHSSDNSTYHGSTNHHSNLHSDRPKHKSHNNKDEVNEIINQNCTSNKTPLETQK